MNLADRVVEVYRAPVGDSYGEKRTLSPEDLVAPEGCEESAIKVAELLP